MAKRPYLEVITGPMYCGKTEELIRQVKRAKIGHKKVQVFKHKYDVRYGQEKKVYSHGGVSIESEVIDNAEDILTQLAAETEIVAIDEAQWLGPELVDVVKKLLYMDKHVVVCGLAMTYDRQPFIPLPELMSLADKVTKLSSVCSLCGEDAVYHKKVTPDGDIDPLTNDPSLVKNLDDKVFEARCRKCFDK